MTTKANYTAEEWNAILQTPVNAGSYVSLSEISLIGAFRELAALGHAVEHPTAPAAAQELVNALVADIREMVKRGERAGALKIEKGQNIREELLQAVKHAVAAVESKGSAAEATAFKQWLLELAEVAAKAHKEGGVLGIGGVRVSDKEKAALAELESALGL